MKDKKTEGIKNNKTVTTILFLGSFIILGLFISAVFLNPLKDNKAMINLSVKEPKNDVSKSVFSDGQITDTKEKSSKTDTVPSQQTDTTAVETTGTNTGIQTIDSSSIRCDLPFNNRFNIRSKPVIDSTAIAGVLNCGEVVNVVYPVVIVRNNNIDWQLINYDNRFYWIAKNLLEINRYPI
jgi:hypothetical protein